MENFKNNLIEWVQDHILTIAILQFVIIFLSVFVLGFWDPILVQRLPAKTILGASLGIVGIALKYWYYLSKENRSLFDKRSLIVKKIDDILWILYHDNTDKNGKQHDWRSVCEILDSFYRESKNLFRRKTYSFLESFRSAAITVAMHQGNEQRLSSDALNNLVKKREFLDPLLDGQTLADYFPELRIKTY